MKSEAAMLKQNPLLINKIIAERLSDKLQIMMVPSDGKFFFNDVLKGGITPDATTGAKATQDAVEDDQCASDTQSQQFQSEDSQPSQDKQFQINQQFQNSLRKNWKSR